MKYLCYFLFFICMGCQEKMSSQGMELYARLEELPGLEKLILKERMKTKTLTDSIVKVAENLPPAEYSIIVLKAANYYSRLQISDKELMKLMNKACSTYLQLLDSLPFPETNAKTMGLLLLQEYAASRTDYFNQSRIEKLPQLAALLFDMENRQDLTPFEKYNLLYFKSCIYSRIFHEPTAAISIIAQAIEWAQQHHISGPPLQKTYRILTEICYRLGDQTPAITFSNELFHTIANNPMNHLDKQRLCYILFTHHYYQKDYGQALLWLRKSGMTEAKKYQKSILQFYLDTDSIPSAIHYLETHRTNNVIKAEIHTRRIAWHEALIYQRAGDSARYEQLLKKAILAFDQSRSQGYIEIEDCAPSEAYARLLWKQGKRNEAIRRMEMVSRQLTDTERSDSYESSYRWVHTRNDQKLQRLQFLVSLYEQAGRPADALRQAQLCDSIRKICNNARYLFEQENNRVQIYTAELERNLNLRAAELAREKQRLYTTALFLGIALCCIGMLILLYYRRKKQVDILYARQKASEQLEEEKQQLQHAAPSTLSPEEQLFNQLEKQFYDKQLFRNPDFSREDLCRLGGSNRMYISTCINKYTGGNINQWINKARVDYAIGLIRSGETNLQVIAENSGFSSTTSFFRNFKQFTKLTPKQYIQREGKPYPLGVAKSHVSAIKTENR